MTNPDAHLIARLHKRIIPVPESGCQIWEGGLTANGYAYFNRGTGRERLVHRIMYVYAKGEIPKGLQLDHLCRVRCCVNPDHLQAVTSRENTLRGIGLSAINARKTHCKNGHPFLPEEAEYRQKNHRCRVCKTEVNKKFYKENKKLWEKWARK